MQITHHTDTYITAINPATTEVLGRVKISSREEIDRSVEKGQEALVKWRLLPLSTRLDYIRRFREVVYSRKDYLSEIITKETGKPICEAIVSEIFGVLETCRWLQANAQRWLSPEKVRLNELFMPGKRSYNVYEPLGVIAVISPFNYPFSIPVSTMVSALTAGNAVVLKPSPKTALVAEAIMELFAAANFPAGLVSLVQGDREQVQHLVDSKIHRVMFTGSVAGGRAIAGLAAKKLIPVTLELGGKHAAIVLADSDVDSIASGLIWGAFTNAGQACASIERMYVERSIAPQLIPRLQELTKQLRLGNGMLADTDVGPLIDESQLSRIKDLVDDAVAHGATLLAGGQIRRDLQGYFFEATLLGGVKQSMRIVQEEIFGPVLPIIEVADAAEAIALTNDSKLGLGASIWSKDLAQAEAIARQIDAGVVWINDGLYTHVSPDAPWGGVKDSGYGRMHSAAELRDLVYVKNIGINSQRAQDWHYPYGANSRDYIIGGVELLHGNISQRINGLKRILGSMLKRSKGP